MASSTNSLVTRWNKPTCEFHAWVETHTESTPENASQKRGSKALGGDMQKSSLYLLMVAAVVVATSSAHAAQFANVPETSGGTAELIAVLAIVGVAFMLRRKTAKKLPI